MRILIVDDAKIIWLCLSQLLGQLPGVKLIGVNSVAGGIQAADEARPDLIVLDLKLPDGSGMEVLQHVKRTSPGTRVAVVTGFDDLEYRNRCFALGADFYFDKLKELDRLPALVRRLGKQLSRSAT